MIPLSLGALSRGTLWAHCPWEKGIGMSRTTNRWKSVTAALRRWSDQGMIEPGQWRELEKALGEVDHARRVQDPKLLEQAIDKIVRVFLRNSDR